MGCPAGATAPKRDAGLRSSSRRVGSHGNSRTRPRGPRRAAGGDQRGECEPESFSFADLGNGRDRGHCLRFELWSHDGAA